MTRQEEEMNQKEEELQRAKEIAEKSETELKEITEKHNQVQEWNHMRSKLNYNATFIWFTIGTHKWLECVFVFHL